ncbi:MULTISPECIES: hypothetical protein [Actinosynnema]|uniref:hypothetical protein n=1 Tax=Actinosynnema TaxID=40566 RepID=UPI0020A4DA0E|nr:hypothetical protein [Actinosynnema pretiosum]MCP2092607.1 hypothetical protein [Actinosynnema pretiosum]
MFARNAATAAAATAAVAGLCLVTALPAAAAPRFGSATLCNTSPTEVQVFSADLDEGVRYVMPYECDDTLYFPFSEGDSTVTQWRNLSTGNGCVRVTVRNRDSLVITAAPGGVRLHRQDSPTNLTLLCSTF